MGTLAKRLGQLAARSMESESSSILKQARSNKVEGSLAKALDATLRRGHDMKTFGLGTAASMASRERYGRFTTSMHAVYSTMERQFDAAAPDASPLVHALWLRHGDNLRRGPALQKDLEDVVENRGPTDEHGVAAGLSPATRRYVDAIEVAGADDRARGGARMLGHLYTRYFADLFGGSVLAAPTRAALVLPPGTPRHYTFSLPAEGGRRALIEDVYRSLNIAGDGLGGVGGRQATSAASQLQAAGTAALCQSADESRQKVLQEEVVEEAMRAFAHNAAVYGEEPMLWDAIRGGINAATGLVVRPKEVLGLFRREKIVP